MVERRVYKKAALKGSRKVNRKKNTKNTKNTKNIKKTKKANNIKKKTKGNKSDTRNYYVGNSPTLNDNSAEKLKTEIMSHVITDKAKKTMNDMFIIKDDKLIGASTGFDYTSVSKVDAYKKAAFMLTLIGLFDDAKKLRNAADSL
jgi:hypothetical protein